MNKRDELQETAEQVARIQRMMELQGMSREYEAWEDGYFVGLKKGRAIERKVDWFRLGALIGTLVLVFSFMANLLVLLVIWYLTK